MRPMHMTHCRGDAWDRTVEQPSLTQGSPARSGLLAFSGARRELLDEKVGAGKSVLQGLHDRCDRIAAPALDPEAHGETNGLAAIAAVPRVVALEAASHRTHSDRWFLDLAYNGGVLDGACTSWDSVVSSS